MKRKTVIVTGLIGSGKSAVCALLRERGIPVYDSDSRTKRLYDRRPALVDAMEKAVGTPLRGKDGALDRKRLAGIIFSDSSAREKVEAVVYPAVLADFKRWKSRQKGAPFVVLESAVALSKPIFDTLAQAVVLVDAPPEVRLARVMRRDSLDAEAVMRRMAAQRIPMYRVDVILSNDGDVQALSAAVSRVFFEENSYLCKILNQSK